jgi:Protein of unknown function (DUF2934)
MAEMLEDRIREHAYHLWEASGRPVGHDEEFWHQACELVAADGVQPGPKSELAPDKTDTIRAQPQRRRSHRTSPLASSGMSAPAV